jgi:GDPmannose 4,6-dehydratase
VAKLYAYWMIVNYREAYDIFACNGILFNHESPRRGNTFVTKKITREMARIAFGRETTLTLGNLEAKRDWGYAPEYCEGMWRILQHHTPDDFVLATGETHTVREFVEASFDCIGVEIEWQANGDSEVGSVASIDKDKHREMTKLDDPFITKGQKVVQVSSAYLRPTEVDLLVGDASRAERELGWTAKTKFSDLVRIMVDADLGAERNGRSEN